MNYASPLTRYSGGTKSAAMRVALFLLTLFVLPLLAPSSVRAQEQTDEQSLTTEYFTIYYPRGEEKTAQWYASFADSVNVSVSELLGAEPVTGLTLHIYATEPDYMQANPMAELHPGILAHAIPEKKEIGVAVERLRQHPPALARESFRHEITHIVAGILSDQNLPIGFHEGLGQYNELSEFRGQEVRDLLTQAKNAGKPYLSLTDLNEVRRFRRNIEVAYPQSYAVMAFLADEYGMEPFAKFLSELQSGRQYELAIFVAFGKRVDDLEKEWRAWLPSFLESGYKRNVLSAHDLSHGLTLLQAGRFKEAEEHFTQSEKLYRDLNRTARAEEAANGLLQTTQARQADEATNEARTLLEAHDYNASHSKATGAASTFAKLAMTDYEKRASDISMLAEKGMSGIRKLEEARANLRSFNLPASQTAAREAGETLGALGDGPRVADANSILQELHGWQQTAGWTALGLGGLVVLGGGAAAMRSQGRRARRKASQRAVDLREQNPSWL